MTYSKPLPALDNWNRPFWDACRSESLVAQECQDCGHVFYPPGPVCQKCRSSRLGWRKLSGRGKVLSWVVFHQSYYKGFSGEIPYNVAMIRLDEGITLLSNIVGLESRDIRVDMRVHVVFERATDEITIPKFRPLSASEA